MKFLVSYILLFGSITASFANEDISSFLKDLPKEQRLTMDWFFRNCMRSFGGYVLCGNKPMCIESFRNGPIDLNLSEWSFAKINAFQILKDWNISNQDKEYLFLFCNYCQASQMIIINRKAFIKTVNDNISLFRYILGRTITAESLLLDLIKNQHKFFEVIKDDALVGILLGYGTNNSLIYSRTVDIRKNNYIADKERFPFYAYIEDKNPSLDFSSLEDEQATLQNMTVGSYSIIDFNTYDIPCFGCVPGSEETLSLLTTYEKNRNDIIAMAEDDHFLEKMLETIFTTTSGKIRLPKQTSKPPSNFDLTDKINMASQFAEILRDETSINGVNQTALLKSFLKGVIKRERKQIAESDQGLSLVELEIIPRKLECCKNLIRANDCFKKICKRKDWVSLIPDGIAYKVLKEGKGVQAPANIKNATFHLSYRLGWEKEFTHFETIKQGEVEDLIPGIAHSLIGMKKGEQRRVCIHPRYAYGMLTPPSNATYIADIQLLDFEEGNAPANLLPTRSLESTCSYMNDGDTEPKPFPTYGLDTCSDQDAIAIYNTLLKKNQELLKQKFYNYGLYFCDKITTNGVNFDFQEFRKKLVSPTNINRRHFNTVEEMERFIFDFKMHLFTLQYENGVRLPFPQSWL